MAGLEKEVEIYCAQVKELGELDAAIAQYESLARELEQTLADRSETAKRELEEQSRAAVEEHERRGREIRERREHRARDVASAQSGLEEAAAALLTLLAAGGASLSGAIAAVDAGADAGKVPVQPAIQRAAQIAEAHDLYQARRSALLSARRLLLADDKDAALLGEALETKQREIADRLQAEEAAVLQEATTRAAELTAELEAKRARKRAVLASMATQSNGLKAALNADLAGVIGKKRACAEPAERAQPSAG